MLTGVEVVQAVVRQHTKARVVSKVPTARPELFVRVDQGVPVRDNLVQDSAVIIVHVYGRDLERVITLAAELHEVLVDVGVFHDKAHGWESITCPHEAPDPDISDHRWSFSGRMWWEPL